MKMVIIATTFNILRGNKSKLMTKLINKIPIWMRGAVIANFLCILALVLWGIYSNLNFNTPNPSQDNLQQGLVVPSLSGLLIAFGYYVGFTFVLAEKHFFYFMTSLIVVSGLVSVWITRKSFNVSDSLFFAFVNMVMGVPTLSIYIFSYTLLVFISTVLHF
jgi:hypothetical protein